MALAALVLTCVAAGEAAAFSFLGHRVAWTDLVIIYIVTLSAVEMAVLAMRLLAGEDQAAATQAGMSGMLLLMLIAVGALAACRFSGILSNSDSIVRYSPLLFLTGLALVSARAIRTIRGTPVKPPPAAGSMQK